jgi:NTE family protein
LLVPVVDAASGDRRVLDRASGVDLVDAVAASSAVPGVWPPVTIEGSRYIDGGVWSLTNTDLASGHDRVLVLAPIVDPALEAEITGLGPDVRVEVVCPDAASIEAFGTDVLDPANREPSARAGHAQGPAEAGRVRHLLAD